MLDCSLYLSTQDYRKMTPMEGKLLLFNTPLVSMQGLSSGGCTPVSSNNLGTHSLLHVSEKGVRFRSPGSTIWEGNSILIFHFWYYGLNGYLAKLLRCHVEAKGLVSNGDNSCFYSGLQSHGHTELTIQITWKDIHPRNRNRIPKSFTSQNSYPCAPKLNCLRLLGRETLRSCHGQEMPPEEFYQLWPTSIMKKNYVHLALDLSQTL